ncbi:MAG: FHA domain-containing protein [Myxococcales bacterium]|nr:FHA domain-containing protein [Myxococcales bacterium]
MKAECGKCGFENLEGSLVCGLCGARLQKVDTGRDSKQPHRIPTGAPALVPLSQDTDQGVDRLHAAEHTPGPLRGRIKLVVEQGRIVGEQFLLTDASILLGRQDPDTAHFPDIDLTVQDPEFVHREHARLSFIDRDTRVAVEHLGGKNLTLVNKEPVGQGEQIEMLVGDHLRVGRVLMRLVSA